MLKRVTLADVRLGMFIDKLDGSWLQHSFWRTRFHLSDAEDLGRLRDSGVGAVWIDTTKGIDVGGELRAPAPPHAPVAASPAVENVVPAAPAPAEATCPIDGELARAAGIVRKARSAVISMFNEARMGKAVDAESAKELVQQISDSVARNQHALIGIARLKEKDEYTYMHSVAVCALMTALGRQLGLDEDAVRDAGLAGLLHDIGKARVPPAILNKPGKLTDAEFDVIKAHPESGHAILKESGTAQEIALDVCLHHHERVDGTGYPHRLAGDAISLYARMGAVCDVYDAITSDRPYKAGWDPGESIQRMAGWSKSHFDERVYQMFVKSVGIYPVGSLVRMESERLGVVTEQNARSLLTPRVKVFFSLRSQLHVPPQVIDLADRNCVDRIVGREDPQRWKFAHLSELALGDAAARRT